MSSPNDKARITLQDCVPSLSRPNDKMGWGKATPNDEPPIPLDFDGFNYGESATIENRLLKTAVGYSLADIP
jgi:hypothetical protein